ncbi:MAG TPA: hypothetical protein VFS31_10990 [Chitinophagaceae bacterium]|nr:hypothetical protein [Chitinophagaceae bacterium]
MVKTTFKVLSDKEQQQVLGGKLPGSTQGTIVGWRYYNGMYYVDIAYEDSETSCDVPWGTSMPQIGDSVG